MGTEENDLGWLNEFEDMADRRLGNGSACEQIHPIVEHWLDEWLDSEMEPPRSSVSQALACLATEVISNTPDHILNVLMEHCDEEDISQWVQGILITGQAFQDALTNGRLDDL